jgi:hypothetical protein
MGGGCHWGEHACDSGMHKNATSLSTLMVLAKMAQKEKRPISGEKNTSSYASFMQQRSGCVRE